MNGSLQQSNIVWPVSFKEEKADDTILRSDRGRKWMKRLELRKTMRENASFVLNPTQHIPSVPSRTRKNKMTYDTRRIANKMLREKCVSKLLHLWDSPLNPYDHHLRKNSKKKKEKEKKEEEKCTTVDPT